MLKNETIEELESTFKNVSELEDVGIGSSVEVINLDLIRIHINARGSRQYINRIIEILKSNNESGPLQIHEEAAKSCNLLYYIDIKTI